MALRMRRNEFSYSRDYLRPSKRRRKRESFDWRGIWNISRIYGKPCGYNRISFEFEQGPRPSSSSADDQESFIFQE